MWIRDQTSDQSNNKKRGETERWNGTHMSFEPSSKRHMSRRRDAEGCIASYSSNE